VDYFRLARDAVYLPWVLSIRPARGFYCRSKPCRKSTRIQVVR